MAIDIQQLITAAVLNSIPSYLLVILETNEIKKRILKGTFMQSNVIKGILSINLEELLSYRM